MASALDQQIAYAEQGDDRFSIVEVLYALKAEKVALQAPVNLGPLETRVSVIESKLKTVATEIASPASGPVK